MHRRSAARGQRVSDRGGHAGQPGEKLTNFAALKKGGAVAVTDDGKPILDDKLMRGALGLRRDSVARGPARRDTRLTAGCTMNSGGTRFVWDCVVCRTAESELCRSDIELAKKTGGHVHVAHSRPAGPGGGLAAKQLELKVTAEVTPHHFALIDEDVGGFDTRTR